MQRRNFIFSAAAAMTGSAAVAARTEPGVSDKEVLLGQSVVSSGPLGVGALAMQGGMRVAFSEANARGGVAGRQLRVVSLDDGLDPARAAANYKALLQEHQVFACVLGAGAGTTLAGLPVLKEAGAPLIGTTAVVDSVREKTEGVAYYTRASQQRESDALVTHLSTLGIQRLAVAHVGTPGGLEVLGQLDAAAARHKLRLTGSVGVAPDGKNASDAGKTLARADAQAVIMFLSGPPAAEVMKSVWAQGGAPSFYGMSILAGDVTARLLGEQSKGLTISQVTPYPWDAANPDANLYRKGCEAAQVPVGYHSYEGYVAGRVTIEALRQAGRELTRERLHAVLRKLKARIAGMDLDFSGGRSTGSHFVELVRVRNDGKFVR
ncbi:ABC transporter substrate-binding protein [Ramlibacter solisilvae]|uniref:Leucine-binding protein domain-containing protein n=1 Tax=Ramlibacter tataouinensis TaxID=94132 RepID=A0A127JX54_9BURK|nr:ABC transporter substrate-binding protein [Ramlibacter tataouinensis]AMO24580.1 hypothetical protein UC35_19215 [Ramlibacter tataouinensis]